jgi:hypothetical protein
MIRRKEMIDKPYNCYVKYQTKINERANMKQLFSNLLTKSDITIKYLVENT